MIYQCPRCKKNNRLPDTLRMDGAYKCGSCGQALIAAYEGDGKGTASTAARPAPPRRPTGRPGRRRRFRFLLPDLRIRLRRPGRMPWALGAVFAAYGILLLVLSLSDVIGPERWWIGSLNLYLPQWLWALPAVVLLPLTFRFARGWLALPVIALCLVLGPLMGFTWNWRLPDSPDTLGAPVHGVRLRVMTYNVKWSEHNGPAIVRDIQVFRPDLIQMQDSGGVMDGVIGKALAGWNVRVDGQYLVASHFPLPPLEGRDISFPGSQHHVVRYALQFGSKTLVFYDAHLLSPREGLVSVRHRQVEGIQENTQDRLLEADRLAGYLRQENGPVVLTGDLNAPVHSLVCRKLFRTGQRDAFSEAGFGYGYTYGRYTRVKQPYVRIDHILVSRPWHVENCWVGNSEGSEHCPVIADIVLPR